MEKRAGVLLRGAGDALSSFMEILKTVEKTRQAIRRRKPSRIVLVPTMGALHEGHRVLIEEARDMAGEGGVVVVSVFVNPTQFGPEEDYEAYPRDLEGDAAVCADAGADLVFAPSVSAMYPEGFSTAVEETQLSQHLCGVSRPGHFSGVCTVVVKLLNITGAHLAVFGEKDFQQLAVIRRVVRDLNLDVEIVGVPTVREDDGLAMSSRNRYLEGDQRLEATRLAYGLELAREAYFGGERSAEELVSIVEDTLAPCGFARVDYIELVDAETFVPVQRADGDSVLAAAVFFGHTRLIDHVNLAAVECLEEEVPEEEMTYR